MARVGVLYPIKRVCFKNIEAVPPVAIVITPLQTNANRGSSVQFTARVETRPDTLPRTVIWSRAGNSHNNTVISASGLLTVANGENRGTVIRVRATSTYNGAYAEAIVNVL